VRDLQNGGTSGGIICGQRRNSSVCVVWCVVCLRVIMRVRAGLGVCALVVINRFGGCVGDAERASANAVVLVGDGDGGAVVELRSGLGDSVQFQR
jgi:hypothetical protein